MEHIILDIIQQHVLRKYKTKIALNDRVDSTLLKSSYFEAVQELEETLALAIVPIWRLNFLTVTFRELIAQVCLTNSRTFEMEEIKEAIIFYHNELRDYPLIELKGSPLYKRMIRLTQTLKSQKPIHESELRINKWNT